MDRLRSMERIDLDGLRLLNLNAQPVNLRDLFDHYLLLIFLRHLA